MAYATHVFHKITIPGYKSKFSAWFVGDPCGKCSSLAYVTDAERIDAMGRSYPVSDRVRDILNRGGWSAAQWSEFGRVKG